MLAACGSDDDSASDGGITVEHAWARTSPAGATTGAVYFDITSADSDTLVAASVPSSVAGDAQIHEILPADTEMSGDATSGDAMSGDAMSGDDTSGEMSGDDHAMDMGDGETAMVMQEMTDGLPLPAGETVSLAPGGYHAMLLDLAEPLVAGDEIDVTLDFATADDMTISVTVSDTAPGS